MDRRSFERILSWAAWALVAVPSAATAQDPPQHPRSQALASQQSLDSATLLGGAVEVEVLAAGVDFTSPAFLNGAAQDGLADLHFEVQLRYAESGVLGSRNAGEFVPYQKIHVRLENTSTASDERVLELDLAPHVGHGEGWHYASNVLLPPGADDVDPFNATYRVTVTLGEGAPIMLHADSMPASRIFTAGDPLMLFDGDVVFGGIATLPVGDVGAQLARAQAFSDIKAAVEKGDFATASNTFEEVLEESVTSRMDPEGYDAGRGLLAGELADLLPNIEAALANDAVGPDCLVDTEVITTECVEWVKKGIERFFYLSILHEIDEALASVAAGDFGATDGAAHKWDEAWAYFQALVTTAGKRQDNCEAGRFGAAVSCDMQAGIEAALLDGSNAILASGGLGVDAAREIIERELLQVFYLGVVHEVLAMREKILAADDVGYNKARVEARAFYRTIAYLVPSADDAVLGRAFEEREPDLDQDSARELITRLGAALSGQLGPDELADPEVTP